MTHILIILSSDNTYSLSFHQSLLHAEMYAEKHAPFGSEWVVWFRTTQHNPFLGIHELKGILKKRMEGQCST